MSVPPKTCVTGEIHNEEMAQSSMSTTDPKTESDSSHVKADIIKPEQGQMLEESDITLTKDNETNNSRKSIHGNQSMQSIPKGRYETHVDLLI